eukprot:359006-Chlamydomonas_euryale.AAC.10
MEAAKASLMAVGQLTAEQVEERLMEARRTYKLNLGCGSTVCNNRALQRHMQSIAVVEALRCCRAEANACRLGVVAGTHSMGGRKHDARRASCSLPCAGTRASAPCPLDS